MKIINMPEQDTSYSCVTDMQEKDTDRVTEKMPDSLMLCVHRHVLLPQSFHQAVLVLRSTRFIDQTA